MSKWMVLSKKGQGYTENNCGQSSDNQQFISIVDGQTIDEAYSNLHKVNPHLFAIDLSFGSMRWTSFEFYELKDNFIKKEIIISLKENSS